MSTDKNQLRFGSGFRVKLNASKEFVGTYLARTRGDGAYVRNPDGSIIRLNGRGLDWEGHTRLDSSERPSPLRVGDKLRLESAAGLVHGTLARPVRGEELVVSLYGQEVPFPLEKLSRCYLEFATTEINPGDAFFVKSKSGNAYEGTIAQMLPDGRVLATLKGGRSADLRLEKLSLQSYVVLIPIPTTGFEADDEDELSDLLGSSPEVDVDAVDGETAKWHLKRARASTARLRRQLLEQDEQLEQIKNERRKLEAEVKERERALESEVWRGLAAQRDLTDARRKLESTDKDEDS